MKPHLFIAAIILASVTSMAHGEVRKWTDQSGSYSVQAEFVELADGNAVLKREDGRVIRVPLDKLSPQDQEYVQKKGAASSKEQALEQGKVALDKNDFDLAISCFTEAIRLDQKCAMAYGYRGRAYQKKGDTDRAITDSVKAIQLDPNNAQAYFHRGFVYLHK